MVSGEIPLQHQVQLSKNQETAEVFTSKPERPQGRYSSCFSLYAFPVIEEKMAVR